MNTQYTLTKPEKNMFDLVAALGDTSVVDISSKGDVQWTNTDSIRWPLGAYVPSVTTDTVRNDVIAIIKKMKERKILGKWMFTPIADQADIENLLIEEGATLTDSYPSMTLTAGDFVDDLKSIDGFEIIKCSSRSDLELWASVVLGSPLGKQTDRFARMFNEARKRNPKGFSFLIGKYNGVPACGMVSYLSEKVNGLYWVSTLKEFRGKGFATVMTRFAVRDGFQRGAAICTLHSTELGLHVYNKLGFKKDSLYRMYSFS